MRKYEIQLFVTLVMYAKQEFVLEEFIEWERRYYPDFSIEKYNQIMSVPDNTQDEDLLNEKTNLIDDMSDFLEIKREDFYGLGYTAGKLDPDFADGMNKIINGHLDEIWETDFEYKEEDKTVRAKEKFEIYGICECDGNEELEYDYYEWQNSVKIYKIYPPIPESQYDELKHFLNDYIHNTLGNHTLTITSVEVEPLDLTEYGKDNIDFDTPIE